jgi:hypothetical protein
LAGARRVALFLAAAAALTPPLAAFETDQFLVLDVELEDSTAVVNDYLTREIEGVLDRVNAEPRLNACEELPPRIFRYLFAHLLSSRLKHFLEHSPLVDRYPTDDVGYWQYLRLSIYRRPIFPYIVPMSSTVKVGGVYLGVDKFGHMMGEGRRYYTDFLHLLRRGFDEEEALRRVVLRHLRWERVLFGGLSNGVLSLADLEGNYQGMRLARAMCEGRRPYLVRRSGRWRLDRPIRIEDFVVPALDESYNPSRFPRGRWKRVRPIMLEEHCPKARGPVFRARLERYRQAHVPSLSHRVLERHFAKKGIRLDEHSLTELCSPGVAVHGRERGEGPVSGSSE